MIIIDGKTIAQEKKKEMQRQIQQLGIQPCLAVLSIGDNSASKVYIRNKMKACKEVGIHFISSCFQAENSPVEIITTIETLNDDDNVNGIIVQLPLPKHLQPYEEQIIETISPLKDVDGLTSTNQGLLAKGCSCLIPCTPYGISTILTDYGFADLSGKHAVIIGRSNLVGKPLAQLLLKRNATVSICHSRTKDLASITRQADILVVAVGKPNLITADMVKDGAVVIDVGINRVNGKLCGDVDFNNVAEKASFITPVPGGVGQMTVAMLLQNTIYATLHQKKGEK